MGKFWSLLFLAVPVLGVASFVWGWQEKIWLPEDHSANGGAIDHLFYFILALTGVVFVITEGAMFWFMWRYDSRSGKRPPTKFVHGSHTLEVVWTIVPAATLLFIAIYQMNVWADNKMRRPDMANMQDPPVEIEVTARQFEWRFRYPGPDKIIGTADDLFTVNELHVPVNRKILIQLKSQDVLHSFFLPNMRVKQDAVPGMKQPVWFTPTQIGKDDLVCAELCGWGHYKMKGRLIVESQADYDKFLQSLQEYQSATQEPAAAQKKDIP